MVTEGRLTPHDEDDIAFKRTTTPCHENPEPPGTLRFECYVRVEAPGASLVAIAIVRGGGLMPCLNGPHRADLRLADP